MPTPALTDLAAFVRRHDPDRFLCALFAPADRREALFALIAFNHEIARAREAAKTPLVALMRLHWWREAIEHAAEGRPPRRHEVATPLHAQIVAGLLDPADLTALVDAREAEAEEEGIPTRAAFDSYLRASGGGVAVAAGRLLGAAPALLPALQAAGAAHARAGVLRSVAALAGQGRCLLPRDALEEAGLVPEAVLRDPHTPAVTALVAALARDGQPLAARARAGLAALGRPAIAAALPLVLARRDLARLAGGRAIAAARGFGDRLAVTLAGLRGRA